MTRKDHQIIFTALGFLAVILRDDARENKSAKRVKTIAKLIESFCATAVPGAFVDEWEASEVSSPKVEALLDGYMDELRGAGAKLPAFDRQTLLEMHELLMTQKIRREREAFSAAAYDDVIAERVLYLAQEQIQQSMA